MNQPALETSSCKYIAPPGNSPDPANVASFLSVLVVDDEPGIRIALSTGFSRMGWRVQCAVNVREAIETLSGSEFGLVVSDMRLPDGDGIEVLRATRRRSPETAVLLLTAYGNVPDAVESMRGGAVDYLTKPISFDQLAASAARVVKHVSSRTMQVESAGPSPFASVATNLSKHPSLKAETGNAAIVGRSPSLIKALRRARAAAGTSADVLVEAESGTGKELLARFIHEASDRSRKPFVAVNCAAVPEHLLESELFGHTRGAFTGATAARAGKFELANGGTLLLDEIGEMPLHLQPKLLRVLQEREFERLGETRSIHVDIRIIATTNASLGSMVEQGRFRSDLYYRLNVIPLTLPPLRERRGDISLLAHFFAEEFASGEGRVGPRLGSTGPRLCPEFLDRLEKHDWPGNVRELCNFMRRVLALNAGMEIDASCFDREFAGRATNHSGWRASEQTSSPHYAGRADALHPVGAAVPVGTPFREMERLHLEKTLALTDGNRTHAAEMLGISLRTVRNKIREYGLPPRRQAFHG
ncbi:MAG TPA: sigma-54 dependent transcriptional regulator [Acidisarcina sp.]